MIKYALYYGVKRSSGELEIIEFSEARKHAELKSKAKADLKKASIGKKYSKLVVATYHGISNSYKVAEPKAEKKASKE